MSYKVKYQDAIMVSSDLVVAGGVRLWCERETEAEAIAAAKAIRKDGRWVIVFDPSGHSVYSERDRE